MKRTDRIKKYIRSYQAEICTERAKIYTEEFFGNPEMPIVLRRAKAFSRFIDEMTLYIGEDDLLLGNTASKPMAASLFPEFSVNWIRDELDTFGNRPRQKFYLSEAKRKEIIDICDKWTGHTHFDRVNYNLNSSVFSLLGEGENKENGHLHPSINQTMIIEHNTNGDGHIIPDYVSLLNTGMNPVIEKAKNRLNQLDETDLDYYDKKAFLEAVVITLEAAISYSNRLSELALHEASKTDNLERKDELVRLAAILKKVPGEKPDTFHEAIQMVLIIHLLIQIESNGHSISMGRMDSYLQDFYQKDIANETISKDDVQQLVECFLLKCFESNKIRDWVTTENLGGNQLFQTITLGGQKPDGQTAVNELSYVFLKALGQTNYNIPTVVVSIGSTTPREFYEASIEALLEHNGGMPAFFNDDIAIKMMLRSGVDLVDARNWAGMGCSEVRVPGKHGTGVTPVYVNTMKILELAINDGINPSSGEQIFGSKKRFIDSENINEVIDMFEEQLENYLPFVPRIEKAIAESYHYLTPTPFLSSIVNYRIDMAKDISYGHGPNYNNSIVHFHGIPNLANSIAAINDVVFKSKSYSMQDVVSALNKNFKDDKSRHIRSLLLAAPKFGNDDEEVDKLCSDLFAMIPEKMGRYKPSRGGDFGCTAQTVVMNVTDGEVIGATPDGRVQGEALADNLSPTPGSDLNGLTAVFNSLSKIDHSLMDNGSILNVRLHPSALSDKAKIAKLAQALSVYFRKGGFQVQFNIIGKEVLIDAQENPQNYQSLVVKVAGFSCFYIELEKKWQDHLIARTEY